MHTQLVSRNRVLAPELIIVLIFTDPSLLQTNISRISDHSNKHSNRQRVIALHNTISIFGSTSDSYLYWSDVFLGYHVGTGFKLEIDKNIYMWYCFQFALSHYIGVVIMQNFFYILQLFIISTNFMSQFQKWTSVLCTRIPVVLV